MDFLLLRFFGELLWECAARLLDPLRWECGAKLLGALRWLLPDQRGSVPQYALLYTIVAVLFVLLWRGRREATVIAPFQVPPFDKFPFGDRTMANALCDAFSTIHQRAEQGVHSQSGTLTGVGEAEAPGMKLPELPDFEVPSPVTIEVKGFSPEALISLARRMWGRERLISGDVLLGGDGFVLIARSPRRGPWETLSHPVSLDGLKAACEELALQILEESRPELVAAHEIAGKKFQEAYERLLGRMKLGKTRREARQLFEMAAVLRAIELQEQKDLPGALGLLQQAASSAPGSAILAYDLGVVLVAMGRSAEAIAAYRKALELNRDFPEALNNLGIALRQKGQLDEAIASYRKALELRPDFPEALYNLGNALFKKGRLDEAIASYRKALELRPHYAEALNNLGVALGEKGQLDEAIASYRKALELTPNDPEILYNLGIALGGKGQLDEAIASYRKALELRPDYSDALNNLGIALRQKGQLDEAIASYGKALALSPDDPDVLYNLGNALSDKRQLDEAIASYRKALELKPDFPEALYNLGGALKMQGKEAEAAKEFAEAQRLDPSLKPPEEPPGPAASPEKGPPPSNPPAKKPTP